MRRSTKLWSVVVLAAFVLGGASFAAGALALGQFFKLNPIAQLDDHEGVPGQFELLYGRRGDLVLRPTRRSTTGYVPTTWRDYYGPTAVHDYTWLAPGSVEIVLGNDAGGGEISATFTLGSVHAAFER